MSDSFSTRRALLRRANLWALGQGLGAARWFGRPGMLAPLAAPFGLSANLALAAPPDDRKFVLIILRGAMDGLGAVAPYGDSAYRAARGRLALDPPGEGAKALLPLVEGFGLHPKLSFLHSLWRDKEFSFLHACATPYRDRSHFDAQDVLEGGVDRVFSVTDGWLNRALTARPPSATQRGAQREGIAISSAIPLVLRGAAPTSSWAP